MAQTVLINVLTPAHRCVPDTEALEVLGFSVHKIITISIDGSLNQVGNVFDLALKELGVTWDTWYYELILNLPPDILTVAVLVAEYHSFSEEGFPHVILWENKDGQEAVRDVLDLTAYIDPKIDALITRLYG
jgi:hypothetical protein